MALFVLLVGAVFYLAAVSSSRGTVAPTRALPANALNLIGVIGTVSLDRDASSLVGMLRRSRDEDESEKTTGNALTADEAPGEDTNGRTASTGAETEDVATVPAPRPELTGADRMVYLETISPSLTDRVDGFDWAQIPAEAPLFRVFDETDTDVVPPGTVDIPLRDDLRLVWSSGYQGEGRAQLEARVGPEAAGQVGMVEVTISERGEVEKARLISAPTSIHGSMLLSVIKAWRFTPATKGGQAVRYRQVMPLIAAR